MIIQEDIATNQDSREAERKLLRTCPLIVCLCCQIHTFICFYASRIQFVLTHIKLDVLNVLRDLCARQNKYGQYQKNQKNGG